MKGYSFNSLSDGLQSDMPFNFLGFFILVYFGSKINTNIYTKSNGYTFIGPGMGCCLMAPRHYPNQCWLIISEFSWHSHEEISPEMLNISVLDICVKIHEGVIKWNRCPRYWPFVRGIHRSPVTSPHKGQWRGALMYSLIRAWTNAWVNNSEAGDLRRHRTHFHVIVMCVWCMTS